MPTYEFFDHRADIGIRARGKTFAQLCVGMARGLVELVAEDSHLEEHEARLVELSAPDAESLLFAWLKELLGWFSTDGFLPVRFQLAEATPTRLRGRVLGGRFDPARHTQGRGVKAITRHALVIRQDGDGWTGEVIVDI